MGGKTKVINEVPKIPDATPEETAILNEIMGINGFTQNAETGEWEQPAGGWTPAYEPKYIPEIMGAYEDSQGYQGKAASAFAKAGGYSSKFDSVAKEFGLLNEELSGLGSEIKATQQMSEEELSGITKLMLENADLLIPIMGEIGALQRGEMPEAYKSNFQDYMGSTVDSAMGTVLNDLATRGVIGSSVLDRQVGLKDKAITDTSAENFQTNIGLLQGLSESKAGMVGQRGSLLNDAERAVLEKYGLTYQGYGQRGELLGQKGTNLQGKNQSYTGAVNALLGSGAGYNNLARTSLGGMANLMGLSQNDMTNYHQSVAELYNPWNTLTTTRHNTKSEPVVVQSPGILDYAIGLGSLFAPIKL